MRELNRVIYGKRSEEQTPDERQLAFEDLVVVTAELDEAVEPASLPKPAPSPNRPRTARNIGHLPEHLPRVERVIEPESTLRPCGCGEMVKIGKDRTERLDIVPAQLRVNVTARPPYACGACERGVVQAPGPARLIEGDWLKQQRACVSTSAASWARTSLLRYVRVWFLKLVARPSGWCAFAFDQAVIQGWQDPMLCSQPAGTKSDRYCGTKKFNTEMTDHGPLPDTHPHLREFEPFLDDLNRESERGAVLISVSYLERQLKEIVSAFLCEGDASARLDAQKC